MALANVRPGSGSDDECRAMLKIIDLVCRYLNGQKVTKPGSWNWTDYEKYILRPIHSGMNKPTRQ